MPRQKKEYTEEEIKQQNENAIETTTQRIMGLKWVTMNQDQVKEIVTRIGYYNDSISEISKIQKQQKADEKNKLREEKQQQKEMEKQKKLNAKLQKKLQLADEARKLAQERQKKDAPRLNGRFIAKQLSDDEDEQLQLEQKKVKKQLKQVDMDSEEEKDDSQPMKLPKGRGNKLQFTNDIKSSEVKHINDDAPLLNQQILQLQQQLSALQGQYQNKQQKHKQKLSNMEQQLNEVRDFAQEKINSKKEQKSYINQVVADEIKRQRISGLTHSILSKNII